MPVQTHHGPLANSSDLNQRGLRTPRTNKQHICLRDNIVASLVAKYRQVSDREHLRRRGNQTSQRRGRPISTKTASSKYRTSCSKWVWRTNPNVEVAKMGRKADLPMERPYRELAKHHPNLSTDTDATVQIRACAWPRLSPNRM